MKKIIISTLIGILLTGCVTPEKTAYTQDEMNNMLWYLDYKCEETGITMKTRVFVPGPYDKKYKTAMFLHCAGHEGSDNVSHLYENDIGKMVYYSNNNNKFVIAVPQCPSGKMWTDDDMIETLDNYITYMASKINVANIETVYLTGFSMGGIGTYKLAMYNPERYKVLMPVCGGPKLWWEQERPDIPDEMRDTSIWAFNNVNDTVVDNLYSKYIISQMWQSENKDAHYTEWRNGHADEYVFENKDNLEWFFSRKIIPTIDK